MQLAALTGISALYWFCTGGGVINASPLADFASGYGLVAWLAMWIHEDSRKTHYWPFSHYGFFLFAFWPIAVPHYLIKTREHRRVSQAVAVASVPWLTVAAEWVGWLLYDHLPDLR